jgi:hypothetical protein
MPSVGERVVELAQLRKLVVVVKINAGPAALSQL